MLKGWTLTDLHCDQCNVTPLMREPAASASADNRARIQFCALCDGSPATRAPAPAPAPAPVASSSSSSVKAQQPDPSESISTLLLQGYSLLGENCINPSCRGIPLVGYPRKKDGTRDGRRMCVSCGGRWIDGNDLGGMTLLPGGSTSARTGTGAVTAGGESPRSRARREMYGLTADGSSSKGKQAEAALPAVPTREQLDEEEEDEYDLEDEAPASTNAQVRPEVLLSSSRSAYKIAHHHIRFHLSAHCSSCPWHRVWLNDYRRSGSRFRTFEDIIVPGSHARAYRHVARPTYRERQRGRTVFRRCQASHRGHQGCHDCHGHGQAVQAMRGLSS